MLKIKPKRYGNKRSCKFFITKDNIEQKESRCFKCGHLRNGHKNELSYLLRRRK